MTRNFTNKCVVARLSPSSLRDGGNIVAVSGEAIQTRTPCRIVLPAMMDDANRRIRSRGLWLYS
ncbi:MAG: hypothetical protein LBT00_09755 [Spirochaetaceae bacterium]|nr:hypothetical protein [Spirochaetaceae bacterium]